MNKEPVTFIQCCAKVFEAWEADYRTQPETYLTHEQCAEMGVSELSADRAAYFCKLWEELKVEENQ